MERIGVLAAILLVLVVARVSYASSRILMDDGKGGGMLNVGKGSPSPTPALSPINSLEDSCHASSSEPCRNGELIACLQYDSKKLFLLVQNTGKNNMNVTIKITPPTDVSEERKITTKETPTMIPIMEGSDIVLIAGEWNCTLHNSSRQISDYAAQLTSSYGAYFLFVTMVIAGGAWACCKFRRGRRADAGIPYQQLEMGAQPQSSSAVVDSNATDGWNEGWDGDWDEEAEPQPSEKHRTGSVSANGLTSRTPRKDGWDMDWDE